MGKRNKDAPEAGKKRSTSRSSKKGTEPEESPEHKPMFGPDAPHYIDVVVFLVIMLIGAILLYTLLPVAFGDDGYQTDKAQDLADLTTTTNQVLMGSSIPKCVYTDTQGRTTEYLDQKVSTLLTEDIYIRTAGKQHLSVSSLQNSIEKNVGLLASSLLPEDFGIVLIVDTEGARFAILSAGDHQTQAINPSHKVISDILDTKDEDSNFINSKYNLRNSEEATITFALFDTNEFDMKALTGGA